MARSRKKNKYYNYQSRRRREVEPEPMAVNMRVITAMIIVLSVLLMEKYDYSIAGVSVDTVYDVVYDNEDFERLEGAINETFKTIR